MTSVPLQPRAKAERGDLTSYRKDVICHGVYPQRSEGTNERANDEAITERSEGSF